ncbi:hypothetical protein F511_03961 [Dorcoceras hygrometricum]|uniref:Uncharacterized protein n=1 Tax=Dorcoceras hygrometricum TaxID=472368 RepID=A0A2Z7B0E1_9LAMI|nr:hypothetical protein F511_03961 [Dorcoceras hygrometricum]
MPVLAIHSGRIDYFLNRFHVPSCSFIVTDDVMIPFRSSEFSIILGLHHSGHPIDLDLKMESRFLSRHFAGKVTNADRVAICEKMILLAGSTYENEIDDFRWRRPELNQLFVIRRRPKINQLEHNQPADDEDQLQALKSEVNQLELELRSLLKKAIEEEDSNSAGRLCVVILADEATVSSRNAKISSRKMNSRRKQQQHPVESLFVSAVATQPVASLAYSVDLVPRRKELKKKQSAAVVVLNQQRSS